jgi:hypothetical protein
MIRSSAPGSSDPQSATEPSSLASNQNALLQTTSDACMNRSMLARDLYGVASNYPTAMLPLLQQGGSLPLSFGSGFSGMQTQVPGQSVDFSSLINGLMNRPQAIGNSLYLQQAFGSAPSGAYLLGQGAPLPSAQLTLPSATLASLTSCMPSLLGPAGARAPPSSKEVQDALATIAAAAAPLPGSTGAPPLLEPEKPTPPGGQPPVVVYMECDDESLSEYQCLLRKQIELFEA